MNLTIEVVAWVDASISLGQDSEKFNNTCVQISTGIPCTKLITDQWGHKWLRLVHNSHFDENDFINIPIESIIYRQKKKFTFPKL